MTIFDLLFVALVLVAIVTLVIAGVSAIRGRKALASTILRRLGIGTMTYLAIVYMATASSEPLILHVGDPQCNDEWCLAVEGVRRTPKDSIIGYDLTLRIFSRARRRAQRENIAADVYLVDSRWKRYDPNPDTSQIPLNTLLQPGESVTTGRRFELPSDAHEIGLRIDRRMGPAGPPICWIIGECTALHKGTIVRID